MANVSDTDMSSLQASSSSTPGQVPAMMGTQVGKGKGNGGDSDSSEHVVRTAVAKRAPSPYPSRSSTPPTGSRRNRTPSPKPKALALMPAPSYACEVANAAMPMPAGQPVSFTPGVGQSTPEVHLHRHHFIRSYTYMGLIHKHTLKPLRQHSTPMPRRMSFSKKPKYLHKVSKMKLRRMFKVLSVLRSKMRVIKPISMPIR